MYSKQRYHYRYYDEPDKPKELSEYEKQLLTPEWKAKAHWIRRRDNGCCRECCTTNNLQVHHLFYVKGRKAWEYSDNVFVTLCKNCHELKHMAYGQVKTYDEKDGWWEIEQMDLAHSIWAIKQLDKIIEQKRSNGEEPSTTPLL